jgi:hypothetical protein
MLTPAFAAISPFEVIFFGKNNVALGTVIKVLGIELFAKHFIPGA